MYTNRNYIDRLIDRQTGRACWAAIGKLDVS